MSDNVLSSFTPTRREERAYDHTFRVGIIGTGWIAEAHAESYLNQPDVKIVALADLIPGKAEAFAKRGYKIVSGGTDNHLLLIDLRTKFPELTGKTAEKVLVQADITTNKNMVPFDSRSPFQTSGIRVGAPAITTRGLKEAQMDQIVDFIDRVLNDPENPDNIAQVRKEVNALMKNYPLFAW